MVFAAINTGDVQGEPLVLTSIRVRFVPKLDPVMVMNEPTLGTDWGKTLKITGGGYEKAP
jgi:hypothetical protein